LAYQLTTIYLPWLLGTLFSGWIVLKHKWLHWSITAGAFALLLFTYSRGGIVIAAGTVLLATILTQAESIRQIWIWYKAPFNIAFSPGKVTGVLTRILLSFSLVGVVVAAGFFLAQSPYFSRLWQSRKSTLQEYLVDIYAGPRLAYASAAWNLFNEYPFTGVGLGASGFYLYDHLPDWSLTTLSEVAEQIAPTGWIFPNSKNLPLRILSETGLPGSLFYGLFILGTLGALLSIAKLKHRFYKTLYFAGLASWIALSGLNFTQDSLADPNQWINLGIILGAITGFSSLEVTSPSD
jgi:O-antigen ligase